MPSVQIKSVPDDVHATLRRRADAEGKSLQEYLLGRLIEEGRRPTVAEVLDRAAHRTDRSGERGIPLDEAAAIVRDERIRG